MPMPSTLRNVSVIGAPVVVVACENSGLPFWSAPTWTIRGNGRVVSVPAAELPDWLWTMTVSPRASGPSPPRIVRRPTIGPTVALATGVKFVAGTPMLRVGGVPPTWIVSSPEPPLAVVSTPEPVLKT